MRTANTVIRLFLSAALALSAASISAAPVQPQELTLEAALQQYDSGRWNVAFGQLSQLADAGDAEAARIAALMVRHGQALYKQSFAVSSDRLQAWIKLASAKLASDAAARRG